MGDRYRYRLSDGRSRFTQEGFWSRTSRDSAIGDACWMWTRAKYKTGYGKLYYAKSVTYAHRVAWELWHGAVPTDMYVCHRCDVKACCRPDHLFLGTHDDNMADALLKGRFASGARNGRHTKPECQPSRIGELCPAHKLTRSQVEQMRARYVPGKVTFDEIAADFGVSRTTARNAVRKVSWSNVV